MALRRQSSLTYHRSTAFFPEKQDEDRATSNGLIQVEKYDEMSDSYYDDVPGNLESIFDAGFAFDNSTLQSGSLSGRDDRSAETSTTGTSDSSVTSDIIMEDLREEVTEMYGRTCHTLDASLGDFKKTRAYRILSTIGKKKGQTRQLKFFSPFKSYSLAK